MIYVVIFYGRLFLLYERTDFRHDDLTVLQVDGAVGDGSQFLIVGDDDESLSEFVAQVEEQLMEFGLVLGVETARRFIGQNDGRIVYQGASHGHALLFTAGKFGWLVVGAVGESHKCQKFFSALLGLAVTLACDKGWNHHVLQGRELGKQLMELENESDMLVAEIGEGLLGEGGGVDRIDTY